MPITIDRDQRDAIYAEIRTDLAGSGDVYLALEEGDYDAARRHRRRYEDDMRLLDDLGWESEPDADEFTLTMPPADLARALRSLNENAGAILHHHITEPIEERQRAARSLLAQTTYGAILGQLVTEKE